jgi:hypothetical protein
MKKKSSCTDLIRPIPNDLPVSQINVVTTNTPQGRSALEAYTVVETGLSFVLPEDSPDARLTSLSPLSSEDKRRKRDYEKTIKNVCKLYADAGIALLAIRTERLYRDKYYTFELYCNSELGFSRQRAYELMKAATTHRDLSAIADTPVPANEAQSRPLNRLTTPEQKAEAMRMAEVDPKSGKRTAKTIDAAVKTLEAGDVSAANDDGAPKQTRTKENSSKTAVEIIPMTQILEMVRKLKTDLEEKIQEMSEDEVEGNDESEILEKLEHIETAIEIYIERTSSNKAGA